MESLSLPSHRLLRHRKQAIHIDKLTSLSFKSQDMIDLRQLVDTRSDKKDVIILCHNLRESLSSLPHCLSWHCEWTLPIDLTTIQELENDRSKSTRRFEILQEGRHHSLPQLTQVLVLTAPSFFATLWMGNPYWHIDLTTISEPEHHRSKATHRYEILQEGCHHSPS